jgi:hypothetical protein
VNAGNGWQGMVRVVGENHCDAARMAQQKKVEYLVIG